MAPVAEDDAIRAATARAIEVPADLAVLTTATGVHWWMQVCEEWGLHEQLLERLRQMPLYPRGPKVTGALHAAGLGDSIATTSESVAELLDTLRRRGMAGKTIVVQSQDAGRRWDPVRSLIDGLRSAGAEVIDIPLYRWETTSRVDEFDALIREVVCGRVDGVTFTSAPAVVAILARASQIGLRDDLLTAFATRTHALCVGPVTAAPLLDLGAQVSIPDRRQLGSLIRHASETLSAASPRIPVAGHTLSVTASAAVIDDEEFPLPPTSLSLLRELTRSPGSVRSRAELLTALPGGGTDEHAVETAMGRLRSALGPRKLVTTVVKRGYRLNT